MFGAFHTPNQSLNMIVTMSGTSPDFAIHLRQAGLRPTRQRVALARVLFGAGHRHVTAESLHAEVKANHVPVALATVYNALNQFRDAGLLREVVVAPGRSYFDTNTGHHHHFYVETDGELHDFPSDKVTIEGLPSPPKGTKLSRVDVVVRVRR
jgi:Fur family transcriptional regulator, iron response regulator